MFKSYLKVTHNVELYPFQLEIAKEIFRLIFFREYPRLNIAITRQAGKTTTLVFAVEYVLIGWQEINAKMGIEVNPIAIGIFAPQHEQAKTDFDRLKQALEEARQKYLVSLDPEESNARTLMLGNKNYCYIFPLTKTSKPQSKTLDVIIYEESNDINEEEKKVKSDPMGTATNAPEISIGVGGYIRNHFLKSIERGDKTITYDCFEVIRQKKEAYARDGKDFHLNYEKSIKKRIEELGEDDPAFRTQYKCEFVLEGGQFCSPEQFAKLWHKDEPDLQFSRCYGTNVGNNSQYDDYVGIDTAKFPDSTIITVIRRLKNPVKVGDYIVRKRLVNWLELRGENYKNQFEMIFGYDFSTGEFKRNGFIDKYNVKAIAIDSTGQGDFFPDFVQELTQYKDEETGLYRVKFSLQTKDILYTNLNQVIKNLLTEVPKQETKEADNFRRQILELQKEYRGELMNCHHPNDDPTAHDDYPDSWALAEYAYMMHTKMTEIGVMVINNPTQSQQSKSDIFLGDDEDIDDWSRFK